ncbi:MULTISPECIES: helix-turn-helix domain-containing protein [Bacillus]|uniref:helix-turn-helix domain-containing protein n=1 Tax=Bacillus TaxID=1386 RepID=UPI0005A33D01|nr:MULTISPECIES: helix-turn-helix transcriptional regulator [Bacillus]CUB58907.1 HTH-type transcriptional regulator ImmR [Bacillus subtilis]AJG58404.1 helix-turn-helix family protein [Bacillus cereus D17]MBG0962483.1 helix-turn-helix transcriptional regulator [Bacillus sp. SRB1LM]MCU4787152.1 helix-turn-helix domain-containing protein [Bacillus cereus]MDA2014209.1 helix-turn-helix transcriptional regulator [Bacillus cereus]
MDVGARLKFLRDRRGWTIEETAERLNMSKSAYGGYETNYRRPKYEVLVQIADLMDSTTDFILGRTENPNSLNFDVTDFLDKGKLHSNGVEITDDQAEIVNALLRQLIVPKTSQ